MLQMWHENEIPPEVTRRQFLMRSGIGAAALAMLEENESRGDPPSKNPLPGNLMDWPHVAPKAKRVLYLFQSGAPSQLDLFDYKPQLDKLHNTDLPDSVRRGQRLTGMTATQTRFPIARSIFKFAQHGKCGAWVSELLPHTSSIVDDVCFIRTMHTEAINHDPAVTFFQTGAQIAGRPSLGAWLAYGLGTLNSDLPTFVAMISQAANRPDQPLYDRLWGSGFLPSKYQGVKFRSVGDPVLDLSNPPGITTELRREMLNDLAALNDINRQKFQDPEIATRMAQYELAFRMQASVPELTDVSREPAHVFERYGADSKRPGSYSANCLLARRLLERGVRCVQLFHRGWDQHTKLPPGLREQCRDTDQPTAALVLDLKERGLLSDTLIVWGGEFGRTVYCQGKLTADDYGRDHHPRCFTVWLTGGGIRPGVTYGETDDFSYNILQSPVHVHDLHATMLHCLGIDHTRLTYKYQGRNHRLTDVSGHVVKDILA